MSAGNWNADPQNVQGDDADFYIGVEKAKLDAQGTKLYNNIPIAIENSGKQAVPKAVWDKIIPYNDRLLWHFSPLWPNVATGGTTCRFT